MKPQKQRTGATKGDRWYEDFVKGKPRIKIGDFTVSADIAQAIWENDDFQDGLEMIRGGLKEEQFTAYTTILQAIKSEIDASEGTKSE